MLDKNDALPLYVQLANLLKKDIVMGKYKEGEVIPSETQLAKKYQITRTTVRRAILDLVNEGLLHQVHGKGTFVCLKQVKYNIWNFGGLTDYLKSKKESAISKVLKNVIIDIDGKPYMKLERARGVKKTGNQPLFLTIDTSIIPLDLFPDIDKYDFSDRSLYDTMRNNYSIHPKRAELGLYPVSSNALTEKVFNLKANTPLLMAGGKVFDTNNIEIETVEVIYGPNMEFKIMANMDIYI